MTSATYAKFTTRRMMRARVVVLCWLASTVFTSVVMPGIGVLREQRPVWFVLGAVGIVVFAVAQGGALFGAVTTRGSAAQRRWRIGFGLASGLSIVLVGPVAANSWETWAWIGAGIVGALPLLLRPWAALAAASAVCLVGIAIALVTGGPVMTTVLIIGLIGPSIALFNASPVWLWNVLADAQAGRDASASLAVSEERLRFAREVHDILGHTLTVIALKAELLERRGQLPEGEAAGEAREIRRLAASALEEIRATVSDSRSVDLGREIEALHRVLEASGVRCEVRLSADEIPEHGEMFARITREAITNVLRHSRATWCEISLQPIGTEYVLRVRNNGVQARSDSSDPVSGGLDGIRERLREKGGRLITARHHDVFELRASVGVTT